MIRLTRFKLIAVAVALAVATPTSFTFAGDDRTEGGSSALQELQSFENSLKIESRSSNDDLGDPSGSSSTSSITNSFFSKAKRTRNAESLYKLADRFFDQHPDIASSLGKKFASKLKGKVKSSIRSKIAKLGRLHQFAFRNRGGGVTPPTS